ncbi:MAG: hypothetical protein KIT73_01305 [Burkholderiales bacterium]|nr:hypothetical protein [Burkholderiales bacterium]
MAALIPAAIIASTALSAMGAIQSANTQAAQLETQARAADYNATMAERQAAAAAAASSVNEDALRRESRVALGGQAAALAQTGFTMGGSGTDLMQQSRVNAELDALNTRYQGRLQQMGLLSEAELQRYEGAASRSNIGAVKKAGYISAGASILSGAAQYGMYSDTKALRAEQRRIQLAGGTV